MPATLRRLVTASLLALATPALAGPSSLIAVANHGATDTGTLLRIDPHTGEALVAVPLASRITSLALDPTDAQLYGVKPVKQDGRSHGVLVRLNPLTGAIHDVGALLGPDGEETSVGGMSFTSDGRLFGVQQKPAHLIEIDPATGSWTYAAPLPTNLGNYGATFLGDDLYVLTASPLGSRLLVVDPESTLALVGNPGTPGAGVGLTVGPDGGLLAVVEHTLFGIDPVDGASWPIAPIGLSNLGSLAYVDLLENACFCDADWLDRGSYVSCVAGAAPLIQPAAPGQLVVQAIGSSCAR